MLSWHIDADAHDLGSIADAYSGKTPVAVADADLAINVVLRDSTTSSGALETDIANVTEVVLEIKAMRADGGAPLAADPWLVRKTTASVNASLTKADADARADKHVQFVLGETDTAPLRLFPGVQVNIAATVAAADKVYASGAANSRSVLTVPDPSSADYRALLHHHALIRRNGGVSELVYIDGAGNLTALEITDEAALALKLDKAGGAMTGDLAFGGGAKITGLPVSTATGEPVTHDQIETLVTIPHIVMMFGQSNASSNLHGDINNHINAIGLEDASYSSGTGNDGESLDGWVSGSAGSFSRGANYLADFYDPGGGQGVLESRVAGFAGASVDLTLLVFQGETDATSASLSAVWDDRMLWLLAGVGTDLAAVRRLRAVIAKVESTTATYLSTVQANQQSVADSSADYAIMPTSGYTRTDGVHVDLGDLPDLAAAFIAAIPA